MEEYKTILKKTDGGLDIFSYYLGKECLKKKFKSPFRSGDNRPSCHLYLNEPPGEQAYYYLQDFGDSRCSGNAFAIAARVLNKTSSIKTFMPVIQEFMSWELEYWNKYGIDVNTLRRYHVHSLRSVTFNKADGKSFNIFGSKAIPAYGYFFNDMKGIKVYRPKAENRFLYGGDLPTPYVFGWEQLQENGDMVFITGGEKDVLSLASHGYNAIAFNSETAKIPADKIKLLSQRFRKIIFLYDSDTTGIKESKSRVEEYNGNYNVFRLELPLSGTKQEKDISDYFALGRTTQDLQKLINKM